MHISWQHQLLHELIFKSSPKKFFLNLVRNWLVSRSIQVALSPGETPIYSDLALEKAKYCHAFYALEVQEFNHLCVWLAGGTI